MSKGVDENKKDIEEFIKALHSLYLFNSDEIRKCSEAIDRSYDAVDQAKRHAKGSVFTHVRIFCWGVNISPQKLINLIPKVKKLVKNSEKITYLDQLLVKILKLYSLDEFIATLQLMIDKYKIEERFGLRKKPGRPKKNT